MRDILTRYPSVAGNPLAMALMCVPLIERGLHADAYALGQVALDIASDDAPDHAVVRQLVHRALSTSIPPFHLDMLRDAVRNACYAEAIARAVRPGMRVLEIGTGAGLLAMLAARAGAEVVTCESNPMIAAAARDIVARNGLSDRIRVIARRSSELRVGEDLEPCDLLVSEIFGDHLIEEGVVAAVDDARRRLLRAGAPIIPPRAELRCALVADDRPVQPPLGTVMGFDLSPFAPLTKARRQMPRQPSSRVALRSAPVAALGLDFTGAGRTLDDRIALVSDGGRIDGVAQWLRLDFGGGLVYENAPLGGTPSHWVAPIHPFATPLDTRPGQTIDIRVRAFGVYLVIGAA